MFDPCAPVPGAPQCVGSGMCCKSAPCYIALMKYPDHSPWTSGNGCPSLLWDEKKERFLCGEIVNAPTEEDRQEMKEGLYVGSGCCASLFNEVRSWKLAGLPLRFDPETKEVTVDEARRTCGSSSP